MNRGQIGMILAFVIAFGLVTATATATTSGQDKLRKTFLSPLKEGQTVVVKEVAKRYEITLSRPTVQYEAEKTGTTQSLPTVYLAQQLLTRQQTKEP